MRPATRARDSCPQLYTTPLPSSSYDTSAYQALAVRQPNTSDMTISTKRLTVSSPERNGVMRTHDVVYTRSGLRGLAEEFKKSLVTDGRLFDSMAEIYRFQWLEKYVEMVRQYLDFDDKADLEYLVANDGRESNAICHRIKEKLRQAGLRSPSESSRNMPVLVELRSGCQWVRAGNVVIIFLIDTPDAKVGVDILLRNEAGHERIETSLSINVGSVIQIYGPSGWRASRSMTFLHICYDIEVI
ncbi:hypothetical protein CCHR01_13100 [Colletotrichum chrysophilum]|uniref:Uncharacterized protein n=1 Tax=Colletotrichum chrysophilum TaxID=1836956 RepID=A0AAD9AEV9_9PEZI|nr:hypothetical protein CCHR01_13100 [Colletotrichum chrysophilum]